MPVISVSGTNGKTTTTRMISHILRRAGRHTGATTSDGVLFDDVLVEAGDLTGPYGARTVLASPDLDVAVLETARGGMMLRGVGYESNDASVLTNVSSDHMDLHGIHTLPELAEVKSVICRITRPDGVVVLNADDDLVAAVAHRVRARVWLFSMVPRSARVRRHLAGGGTAFVLDDGELVEMDTQGRRPIIAVTDVPATLGGLARHNIANALAAAAGARALGATRAQVAAGLRTFAPSAEQAPGRLNLYRRGDTTVIVDFAHNEAGVSAVLDVAAGLVGDARHGPGSGRWSSSSAPRATVPTTRCGASRRSPRSAPTAWSSRRPWTTSGDGHANRSWVSCAPASRPVAVTDATRRCTRTNHPRSRGAGRRWPADGVRAPRRARPDVPRGPPRGRGRARGARLQRGSISPPGRPSRRVP